MEEAERGNIDWRAAKTTQRRYDRQALWYDLQEMPMEFFARRLRRRLWANVDGGRVLEVGVGTGRNLPYHPPQSEVAAIDISPKLLAKAARKARRQGRPLAVGRLPRRQHRLSHLGSGPWQSLGRHPLAEPASGDGGLEP